MMETLEPTVETGPDGAGVSRPRRAPGTWRSGARHGVPAPASRTSSPTVAAAIQVLGLQMVHGVATAHAAPGDRGHPDRAVPAVWRRNRRSVKCGRRRHLQRRRRSTKWRPARWRFPSGSWQVDRRDPARDRSRRACQSTPPAFHHIVRRAIEKAPGNRYQSANGGRDRGARGPRTCAGLAPSYRVVWIVRRIGDEAVADAADRLQVTGLAVSSSMCRRRRTMKFDRPVSVSRRPQTSSRMDSRVTGVPSCCTRGRGHHQRQRNPPAADATSICGSRWCDRERIRFIGRRARRPRDGTTRRGAAARTRESKIGSSNGLAR